MRAPFLVAWLSGLAPYRLKQECMYEEIQSKDELYPPSHAAQVLPLEASKTKPSAVDTVRLEGGLTLLKGRVNSMDLSHVDNASAKVHGGLRLSKCAVELVNTLRWEIQDGQLSFRGKRVLELGCGHGLPGIFACLKGASVVHFQDLSAEVLRNLTIPNVAINLEHAQSQTIAKMSTQHLEPELHYYAGDWRNMDSVLSLVRSDEMDVACSNEHEDSRRSESEAVDGIQQPDCDAQVEKSSRTLSKSKRLLMGSRACERGNVSGSSEGGYDIILMSDTVNATTHLPALYSLIMKCLRPVYGVVYLAGKKHYYGSGGGGGTRQFKSMVDDDGFLGAHLVADLTDTSFNSKEVWKFFYH